MDDRRKFTRIIFSCNATLTPEGQESIPIKVMDLSLNGALIEAPSVPISIDKKVKLSIQLDSESIITMEMSVKHIEEGHLGLHCEHFDIDSATHLRRLVELNIGNQEILNRELANLSC